MKSCLPYSDDKDARLSRYLDLYTQQAAVEEEDIKQAEQDDLLKFLILYKSSSILRKETRAGKRLQIPDKSESLPIQAEPFMRVVSRRRNPVSFTGANTLWIRIAALFLLAMFAWIIHYYMFGDHAQLVAESGPFRVEITLDDGSGAVLRPYSRLYRLNSGLKEHQFRVEGEIYFDVIPDPQRIFRVVAGESIIQVIGTRFMVRTWGPENLVYLEEGSVMLATANETQKIRLDSGERSGVLDGRILPVVRDDARKWLGWMEDLLILDRRSLAEILLEVGHHFQVKITADQHLDEEIMSGSLLLDHADSVLSDLAISIGAGVRRLEEGHYHLYSLE